MCTSRGGDQGDLRHALTTLQRRAATLAPGSVVYISTGQVRQALWVCVLGPPAVVAGKVLAEWVRLLAPPKRWRRPRRRGS